MLSNPPGPQMHDPILTTTCPERHGPFNSGWGRGDFGVLHTKGLWSVMTFYKVVTLVICDTHTPYQRSLRAEMFFLFISRMAWSGSTVITLAVLQKVKRRWSPNVLSDLHSSIDNKISLSYTIHLNCLQCYALDTSIWIPHVLIRSWRKPDPLGRVRCTRWYALTQADILWHCKNKIKF